ncbi:MAG: hypothetical protein HPY55_09995 [Firmicutes bacterium]|nr:hypothetical protein [Bacillota bacterium]
MGVYGFVSHFLDASGLAARYRFGSVVPSAIVEAAGKYLLPPSVLKAPAVSSRYGSASGWLAYVSLTARQVRDLPRSTVIRKAGAGVQAAKRRGATVAGLGFTPALARESAQAIARAAGVPVITGSGFALSVAVDAIGLAARSIGFDLQGAGVTVAGWPSPAGEVCAHLLARVCCRLTLAGPAGAGWRGLAGSIMESTGLSPRITADTAAAASRSDVVVMAGAVNGLETATFKRGSVVWDLAGSAVAILRHAERRGVLVIDGGLVEAPQDRADPADPPSLVEPALAAVMAVAMEERFDGRLEGREVSVAEADEMKRLAERHGFRTAGPAQAGRLLGPAEIDRVTGGGYVP